MLAIKLMVEGEGGDRGSLGTYQLSSTSPVPAQLRNSTTGGQSFVAWKTVMGIVSLAWIEFGGVDRCVTEKLDTSVG